MYHIFRFVIKRDDSANAPNQVKQNENENNESSRMSFDNNSNGDDAVNNNYNEDDISNSSEGSENDSETDKNGNDDSNQTINKKSKIRSKARDKKKNQKFCLNWLTEFKWVREINGKTRCAICAKDVKGSAFHLRRHANSNSHVNKAKSISKTSDVKESINNTTTLRDNIKEYRIKTCLLFMQ